MSRMPTPQRARIYKYLPHPRGTPHHTNNDDDDVPYDVTVWNVQHNKARAASRDLDDIIVIELLRVCIL